MTVWVITLPGAVDMLAETTVKVVRLPEMLVVDMKVCVTVVSLPGKVVVMILPGRVTVVPGRLDVVVRLKISVTLFNRGVS